MTTARIKPFCKKYNVNIGYYDNIRVYPRFVAERNKPLYLYKNHFCFIWKSEGVSFRKAIQEFKKKFKVCDSHISEKLDESFINDE